MSSPRTLVVVRHAKAEVFASSDAERALTERGRQDAHVLGAWLGEQGIVPEVALVSSALRTRETWAQLADGAGWELDPRVSDTLYTADETTALELVAEVPDTAGTVVVVGHNPTASMLVQLLDDGQGDEADLAGMPTSTAAVLDLEGPWGDLAPMSAHLRAFHVARA